VINPKISIITVCFNSEATIGQTIRSANDQSYSNIEHIFIDGASHDRSLEVIDRESRIPKIVISEPDNGIYDALNKGLSVATGDIVGFLHADDFYADSQVLEKVAAGFSDSSISGVYGDLQYVSKKNADTVVRSWTARDFSPARLKRGWMPPHPTLYVRKSCYEYIGGFDTRYRIAADYFSILQLFSDPAFHTVYIPEVLVKMRIGGMSNRSLNNIMQKSGEDYDALRRSEVGGWITLALKNLRKIGQFFREKGD